MISTLPAALLNTQLKTTTAARMSTMSEGHLPSDHERDVPTCNQDAQDQARDQSGLSYLKPRNREALQPGSSHAPHIGVRYATRSELDRTPLVAAASADQGDRGNQSQRLKGCGGVKMLRRGYTC